uniref:Acid phosphatase 2, lysosomal n=1 Tax=Eptatretus burgeri TaxID=7764 RepID=A0A8C4N9C7_EPTBU
MATKCHCYCLGLVMFAATYSINCQSTTITTTNNHTDWKTINTTMTDSMETASTTSAITLTPEGMRQHYELGHFLRKRYSGFLNQTYLRAEVHVRSTDVDRTLMSAEADLAGLFPLPEDKQWQPHLSWQPIPVHTRPTRQDRVLRFPLWNCPRYRELMQETEESASYQKKACDNQVSQSIEVHILISQIVCSQLDPLYFCLCRCSLRSIISPPSKFSRQFLAFPTFQHDTTLAALQMALGVFNNILPPYAGCHIFELYQLHNGSAWVEQWFRNSSTDDPYPLTLPGCTHACPLEKFLELTASIVPIDWHRLCVGEHKSVLVMLAIATLLTFVTLVLIMIYLLKNKKKPRDGYHPVEDQDQEQDTA